LAATRKRGGKARLKTHHEKPEAKAPRARNAPVVPKPKSEPRPPRKASMPTSAISLASDESRSLAIDIAASALEKKAVGLEILDVAGKVDYADFLVLMSGRSDRQVMALADGIQETLAKRGRKPLSIEGMPHASWVLMDFGDVVVHVFQEEARSLYDIEGLWLDARRLPVPHDEVP
jgi:ribosome-associated protein